MYQTSSLPLQNEVWAGETSTLLPSTYCVAAVVVGLSSETSTLLPSTYCVAAVVVGLSSGTVVIGWPGVAGGGLALLSTFGDPLGGVSLGDGLAAGDEDLLATCTSAEDSKKCVSKVYC